METQVQIPVAATGILRRMTLSYGAGALVVLLVALFTHLPTSFGQFSTDDFLIRAMTAGDPVLFEKGFAKADPDKPVWRSVLDGFHFYTPGGGTLATYREYGNLPWWTAEAATMNPLRPVTAFTHWIDMQIAPDSFAFQSFHSLLYILLFAWSGYRLFWRISPVASVAVLASLLLVVDFSHLLNYKWVAARNVFIAGALGCAALERFLAWRQQGSPVAMAASILLFTVGLLSAEATVAVGGYLVAYLLLVERSGLAKAFLLLLPYGVVVILWRLTYNQLGFGADGIGLYVDPGRSLLDFLKTSLQILPLMLASVITSMDGFATSATSDARLWLSLGSAVLALGCVALVLPLLRQNPWVRFMLAGSLLAAVPGSALISAGSRSGLFLAIGFFWVMAMWLHWLARNPGQRFNRVVFGATLCLHLFFPAFAGFVYTSQLLPVGYFDDEQFESVAKPLQAADGHRALVIVNSPIPTTAFYLPFEWRFKYGVAPDSMKMLAPGLVTFDLKRKSAREFELIAPAGLPLNHTSDVRDLQGNRQNFSSVYAALLLQGLFTSPETRMQPGFRQQSAEMQVTVLELVEGRPSRLRIEFTGTENPDEMLWQRYDWKEREYRALPVPAIGETRHFAGPFDTDADLNVVKLCVNCEN